MMPEESSFQVQWSRRAIDTLKQRAGDKELARMVRSVDQQLRRDPLQVGEVYRVRGRVKEHLAVYQALAIDFAVDTQRKFVLVRTCHILSAPQD